MGLVTRARFPTYPEGFPTEIIDPFESATGRSVLGNRAASGTAIIEELGREHMATGRPIVYTSADSVFQIAAHVEVVPLGQLYDWCEVARRLLQGPHGVARVIARPFRGEPGAFVRTKDRRDLSLDPPGRTYLDALTARAIPVLALGKIGEIFAGRGIGNVMKVASNDDNLALLLDLIASRGGLPAFEGGLLFTNLVDFDTLYGHRNDADGFALALEAVDRSLPRIIEALRPGDLLLLTADHGVDPTTPSTDHSREYVPVLVYPTPAGAPAGTYQGDAADIGATVFRHLATSPLEAHEVPDPGMPIQALAPARGWGRFVSTVALDGSDIPAVPTRVGRAEAAEAAAWLAINVGRAPDLAVVLGSGLLPASVGPPIVDLSYDDVPHWPVGTVPGHRYVLSVTEYEGSRVAFLQGRVHEYEGFDLGEEQLSVHTLATWGVENLLLTSASGAVAGGLAPGEVVVISEVLDFHYPAPGGRPWTLPATPVDIVESLRVSGGPRGGAFSRTGVHASLPGPNYETPAELQLLRSLGVDTVSMSPAAELRAAHDRGLRVAVAAVVANAGDTTHDEVLAGVARAGHTLSALVTRLLELWALRQPLPGATSLY